MTREEREERRRLILRYMELALYVCALMEDGDEDVSVTLRSDGFGAVNTWKGRDADGEMVDFKSEVFINPDEADKLIDKLRARQKEADAKCEA